MARRLRVHYPSGLYHVMLRGNNRRDLFLAESDRLRFGHLLADGLGRFGHRIHAYCLMTNHVHLAVQVGEIPLSRIMQNLSFRYTQWFNRGHGRSGHLFQGRYKAIIVEADRYLLELIRYIHRNPIEAGLVRDAADYPWSSHRAYLGEAFLPWLTTDWVLAWFAAERTEARRQLDSFVHRRAAPTPFEQPGQQGILGDESFAELVLGSAARGNAPELGLHDILAAVGAEYALRESDLAAPGKRQPAAEARAMAALLIRRESSATFEEAARRLDRAPTTLAGAATRLDERRRQSPDLAARLARVEGYLGIKESEA